MRDVVGPAVPALEADTYIYIYIRIYVYIYIYAYSHSHRGFYPNFWGLPSGKLTKNYGK